VEDTMRLETGVIFIHCLRNCQKKGMLPQPHPDSLHLNKVLTQRRMASDGADDLPEDFVAEG